MSVQKLLYVPANVTTDHAEYPLYRTISCFFTTVIPVLSSTYAGSTYVLVDVKLF